MKSDPNAGSAETLHPAVHAKSTWQPYSRIPGKDNLHPYVRLTFGSLANAALAIWILRHAGRGAGLEYAFPNLFWASLLVVVPISALVALLPVLLFGRDIPRLLAIGLAFLPAYAAVAGFSNAWSLWSLGN